MSQSLSMACSLMWWFLSPPLSYIMISSFREINLKFGFASVRLALGSVNLHTHHFGPPLKMSTMAPETYKEAVLQAKEHIKAGDIHFGLVAVSEGEKNICREAKENQNPIIVMAEDKGFSVLDNRFGYDKKSDTDTMYPMYFGVSCVFFALQALTKSHVEVEKWSEIRDSILQGSAQLLGLIVWKVQKGVPDGEEYRSSSSGMLRGRLRISRR
ncbi:uncharacterized protein [Arachis hypogaea]|uniref:uncharacterized protein isoform X2 n=1 Tax=Arachis hypogaea TaxID=3818 RepID=UPI003B21EB38